MVLSHISNASLFQCWNLTNCNISQGINYAWWLDCEGYMAVPLIDWISDTQSQGKCQNCIDSPAPSLYYRRRRFNNARTVSAMHVGGYCLCGVCFTMWTYFIVYFALSCSQYTCFSFCSSRAMTDCLRHECCCFAMLLGRQFCLLFVLAVSKLIKANSVGHLSACLLFKICYDLIDLVLPIICSFKLQHSNSKVSMSSCSCSIMHDKLVLLVPYFGYEEHSVYFLANAAISTLPCSFKHVQGHCNKRTLNPGLI